MGFIQVKLLRVLQEREVERVGDSRRRKIDIRIVTATHKDLYTRVREGLFREDLYYRLKVFPIHLPPLRERRDDIPFLVDHFIKSMNEKTGKHVRGISGEAMRIFMDYPWPGNVRELENAIEHAFVLCNRKQIDISDLPFEIRQPEPTMFCYDSPAGNVRVGKQLTRDALLELLNACEWNKAEAARRVGLSRTAIWKYMKKWDIPLRRDAAKE